MVRSTRATGKITRPMVRASALIMTSACMTATGSTACSMELAQKRGLMAACFKALLSTGRDKGKETTGGKMEAVSRVNSWQTSRMVMAQKRGLMAASMSASGRMT